MAGKSFGEFLKDLRISYGYKTQKQLAEISGISQTTLSRIEAGTQRPQPETLRILAEHLRPHTYGELMEQAGYFEGLPTEDKEFVMDLFDESEEYEVDKSIDKTIRRLSSSNQFNAGVETFLMTELGPLFESEDWTDIEFTPHQIRQLIKELDSNLEYKKIILGALERVVKLVSQNEEIIFNTAPFSPVDDPQIGIFFRDFLDAPEDRKAELLRFWNYIREAEKDRKPGDRQGE